MGGAVAPRWTRSSKSARRGDCILRLRHRPVECSRRWRAASGRAPPGPRLQRLRVRSEPRSAPPSNERQQRHRTVPSRRAATAAGSRPPSRPAAGRRAPETAGRKSALAWIRSTDTPPTARRGRIALRSRRRGSGRPGTACGRRPAARPRGPLLSSDAGYRRAGSAHRATSASGDLKFSASTAGPLVASATRRFLKQIIGAVARGPEHYAAPIRRPQRAAFVARVER